ncbi:hypothetical protein Pla110_13500 [Polystyrenella longa]|uniref:Tox-ART-HYD1 domain-containing protein n=1 Tax=Polystyrenella longa TaxID=2528007 RepID=A0A518CK85_9PLAN|nr:HYD1 signature containing ADP-ribosyltransferase family protein [Polystyrenella longa]QDU79639.1 hypothetical protein Pla110_13500 [Polystyrenella longa]
MPAENGIGSEDRAEFTQQLPTKPLSSDCQTATQFVSGGWALSSVAAGSSLGAGIHSGFSLLGKASLAYSAGRVVYSGGQDGKLDLALDAISLGGYGLVGKIGSATFKGASALRTASYVAAYGADGIQTVRGGFASYDAYRSGDYVGGTLNLIGAGFGAAGLGVGAPDFFRNVPRLNPINYRPDLDTFTMGGLGAGSYNAPTRMSLAERQAMVVARTPAEVASRLARANDLRRVRDGIPSRLFHYTDEAGEPGIRASNELFPSLKALNPKDARYGDGQYLTDIVPGTKTPAQLSRAFIGQPFQGRRFSNFVEIDVSGLRVIRGRDGVFVVPNTESLNVTGRVLRSGVN